MARSSRFRNPFGLAFLDVMSCGLGAAVLLFLIVDHNLDTGSEQVRHSPEDAQMLETEVVQARREAREQQREVRRLEEELARIVAVRVATIREQAEIETPGEAPDNEALIRRIRELEQAVAEEKTDRQNLARMREGRRQYTAGFRIEGRRILILLDRSASMTHAHIAAAVRTQFLPQEQRRGTAKWRHALSILEWLLAHLPADARYQVLGFSETVQDTGGGDWLQATDGERLQEVMDEVRGWVPEGGTDLGRALARAQSTDLAADAVYLITDGLPTQGTLGVRDRIQHLARSSAKVSPKERADLFAKATTGVSTPGHHVILLPMEGDPQAPGLLWHFANRTGGQFLSPTPDWP